MMAHIKLIDPNKHYVCHMQWQRGVECGEDDDDFLHVFGFLSSTFMLLSDSFFLKCTCTARE